MSALTDIENRYDGSIPPHVLACRNFGGSQNEFALVGASIRLVGCKGWVRGQIKIIRARRVDGSFYPALIEDLQIYRRMWRRQLTQVIALRAVVNSERAANARLAEAAE
jgi:hypothetical protein